MCEDQDVGRLKGKGGRGLKPPHERLDGHEEPFRRSARALLKLAPRCRALRDLRLRCWSEYGRRIVCDIH